MILVFVFVYSVLFHVTAVYLLNHHSEYTNIYFLNGIVLVTICVIKLIGGKGSDSAQIGLSFTRYGSQTLDTVEYMLGKTIAKARPDLLVLSLTDM